MKKVIERIVESPGAPNENDLWLNGTTLKKFENGEWKVISGGESSCGCDSTPSGGGCNCPGVMFVNTEYDNDEELHITDDDVTAFDIADYLDRGGLVYLKIPTPLGFKTNNLVTKYYSSPLGVTLSCGDALLIETVSEYTVNGTVGSDTGDGLRVFTPSSNEQLSWLDAKDNYQYIDIYLSWQEGGVTKTKQIDGYSSDFHFLFTEEIDSGQDNYVAWIAPNDFVEPET